MTVVALFFQEFSSAAASRALAACQAVEQLSHLERRKTRPQKDGLVGLEYLVLVVRVEGLWVVVSHGVDPPERFSLYMTPSCFFVCGRLAEFQSPLSYDFAGTNFMAHYGSFRCFDKDPVYATAGTLCMPSVRVSHVNSIVKA